MFDGKHLLIFVLNLLAISSIANAEYDVQAFCTLVASGTKLGSIDSCETFYTCKNGNAEKSTCPTSQSYDAASQQCKASSQVSCYYGVSEPCANVVKGFVPIDKSCRGWIYCVNGAESHRGQCPSGQTYLNGKCEYSSTCTDDSDDDSDFTTLKSACQIMPTGIYFGDTLSCENWHICKAGQDIKSGKCDNNLNFNVQNQKCTDTTPADICARVTNQPLIPDESVQEDCAAGDVKKPSDYNCNIYYTCKNLKWVPLTCQSGQYFDIVSTECVARLKAQTSATCNRCLGAKKRYVNAVDTNCRKYYSCNGDNKASDTKECPDDNYFNETNQVCVYYTVGAEHYTDYVKEHGACA